MYRILNILAFIGCIFWVVSSPSPESVVALILSVAGFFRDKVHGIIGLKILSLTQGASLKRNISNLRYSFTDSHFINPKILEDLDGWVSDSGDQIVSINLNEANKSNRYNAKIEVDTNVERYPIVSTKYEEDDTKYSYQYLGCSFSGVHILQTWNYSEGTGVFCSILLVTLSSDTAINFDIRKTTKVERLVIKKIGAIPLGDRYEGNIRYKFGILYIPTSSGLKSLRDKPSFFLVL